MVSPSRAAGRRRLQQGNRYVGSRLHHVRTHRWKSPLSRWELARPAVPDTEITRNTATRPSLEIYQESTVPRHEVSIDSELGSIIEKVFWESMFEGVESNQKFAQNGSKIKNNSISGLVASLLWAWKGRGAEPYRVPSVIELKKGNIHFYDQ
jgi:hypothetical protein